MKCTQHSNSFNATEPFDFGWSKELNGKQGIRKFIHFSSMSENVNYCSPLSRDFVLVPILGPASQGMYSNIRWQKFHWFGCSVAVAANILTLTLLMNLQSACPSCCLLFDSQFFFLSSLSPTWWKYTFCRFFCTTKTWKMLHLFHEIYSIIYHWANVVNCAMNTISTNRFWSNFAIAFYRMAFKCRTTEKFTRNFFATQK